MWNLSLSAKEVPLMLLLGPPSFAWKNMTCFLKHWAYVCVCSLQRRFSVLPKTQSTWRNFHPEYLQVLHVIKCNWFSHLDQGFKVYSEPQTFLWNTFTTPLSIFSIFFHLFSRKIIFLLVFLCQAAGETVYHHLTSCQQLGKRLLL